MAKTNITVIVNETGLLAVLADQNVNVRFVDKTTGKVVQVDEDSILTENEQFEETKSLLK